MLKFFLVGIITLTGSLLSPLIQANTIVVLGDSISANYGLQVAQGWVNLMTQKLKLDHPHYTVHNASISGDTTAGGRARLTQLLTQYQPDIVILELGANDALRGMSLKKMQKNLSTMIEESKKSGADVLLLSMRIPGNYGKRYTNMFYDSYQTLADQYNISVVPFILKGIALDQSLMQKDNLHPNKTAQPLIMEHIYPYLRPLLKNPSFNPVDKTVDSTHKKLF